MNNLTKIFLLITIVTLITACDEELITETAEKAETTLQQETQEETSTSLEQESDIEALQTLKTEVETTTLEVLSETEPSSFEVQYDQSLIVVIPLAKSEDSTITLALSVLPSLGEVIINDNSIEYIPSGILGEDTLTLMIINNGEIINQKFDILVSDKTPYLVLTDSEERSPYELEGNVTIWGYNLGGQQGDSKIELCDLLDSCQDIIIVNHWQNADENLPSALEDLNASYTIQEVNFSLPETSSGDKLIRISNQYGTSELEYTIEAKTFEITFDETSFEVQFDKGVFTIPLNIVADDDHIVTSEISIFPLLGTASIDENENAIKYTPSGEEFGTDTLSIIVSDENKAIEQEFELLIIDKAPHFAFSDIISGPATGLGDGDGSGVIVTVWGFKLGDTQGDSTIELCDFEKNCTEAASVYYWKNADGELPSGPANLYESHRMQEIAFSIPSTSNGEKLIKVTNKYGSSTLPFTVRDGNIYHVMNSGNDVSGDGSFANPWLTVSKGDSGSGATAGDTLYIHNIDTTATEENGTGSYAYYLNQGFSATEENQFAYISYPNTRANLYGKVGIGMYRTTGIVSSKLSVFASNCDDETLDGCTESGTNGITPSDWGRVVGNTITDRPGMCASGQAGAISGGINTVEGSKIFGNYIYEYGCPNSSKLHHTTYLTIRDLTNDATLAPPDMGWNYLKDNHAKNGLHFYDENVGSGTECGQWSGDVLIHDNVVVNQGGNGISYESACGWDNDARIYNNVLINVGLPIDIDCTSSCGSTASGIHILDGDDGGIEGDVYIYNNTIHTWDSQDQSTTLQSCIVLRGSGDTAQVHITENVCYSTLDRPFLTTFTFGSVDHSDNLTVYNNSWHTTVTNAVKAIVPTVDDTPTTGHPLITTIEESQVFVVSDKSPLKNKSEPTLNSTLLRGVYGDLRTIDNHIGAVQKQNSDAK